MSATALEARDLAYTHADGRRAVDGVSVVLGTAERTAVIGPNGAGKTTLFHLLAGLLEPDAGEVEVFQRRWNGAHAADVRRDVGFVFQETEDQLFCPTVFDDVAFGPLNFGVAPDRVPDRVREALDRVGVAGLEDRPSQNLSSGERRRVAIASVLSYRPRLLLLDEPTSDLDPLNRRELARCLEATGTTRLLASHDLEFVLVTCERVLLLASGRIRADGPVCEVLGDPDLLERHGLLPPLGLRDRDPGDLAALREAWRERELGSRGAAPAAGEARPRADR